GSLFAQLEDSTATVAENFTLGVAGQGDALSSLSGASSGVLLAGQEYAFTFSAFTQTRDASGATSAVAASAGGSLSLRLTAVPEPATLALLGVAGMLGARRVRRT
ncbi:MAG: PEP-CTERM sorting domain-containing protein, partial [Gammaproteobacteria bacterium]